MKHTPHIQSEADIGFRAEIDSPLDDIENVDEAIRMVTGNFLHHQVGWSREKCEKRIEVEKTRQIPKSILDVLSKRGWTLRGKRLLDVGCGQGATVLEALERGADAYGVEPGSEFCTVSKMRLDEAGYKPERISADPGEALPFSTETFDYAVSLQVLEHVPDPRPVMEEIYRVLKPGGGAFISCENYLAFSENHYRVPWLPLLPKRVGAAYLRAIGRNPDFLWNHVYYSTYPQIWRCARQVGFENLTYRAKRYSDGLAGTTWQPIRDVSVAAVMHLLSFWRAGVRVYLEKPAGRMT